MGVGGNKGFNFIKYILLFFAPKERCIFIEEGVIGSKWSCRSGINLAIYCMEPRNLCTDFRSWGGDRFCIVLTLSWVKDKPPLLNVNPRNS